MQDPLFLHGGLHYNMSLFRPQGSSSTYILVACPYVTENSGAGTLRYNLHLPFQKSN
ncbi:hypothetical protein Mapa_004627 [Marchantia paleacea]|nr:hypothetical protein Mapa_004627 [Marchantia paleacea]